MVLKEKNKVILSCNCCNNIGCGNLIIFTQAHDRIWISCNVSEFHIKQFDFKYFLEKKLERIKRSLKNKYNYFGEVILSEEELKDFLQYLKKITLEIKEEDEYKEKTKLNITKERQVIKNNEYIDFIVNLKGKISLLEILKNKEYKYYETSYSKKEMLKYIEKLEKQLTTNKGRKK